MENFDYDSLSELFRFVYAAGHMCIFLLGAIFGWQK